METPWRYILCLDSSLFASEQSLPVLEMGFGTRRRKQIDCRTHTEASNLLESFFVIKLYLSTAATRQTDVKIKKKAKVS